MRRHAAYRREAMGRGHMVAFGRVADPAGAFGMGIVEFPGEAEARAFTDGDPTVRSGQGFSFEVHPRTLRVVRA